MYLFPQSPHRFEVFLLFDYFQVLLRDYLGTEMTPRALAKALIDELDYHRDHLDTVFKIMDK